MRLKHVLATSVASLVAVLAPVAATPAAAAGNTTSATFSTNWGWGQVQAGWRLNPYKLDPVQLRLKDQFADGYAVAIRLVTVDAAGTHNWKYRVLSAGAGSSATWTTYADTGHYVDQAYIQVCKVRGGVYSSCGRSAVMTPPFDDSRR